jgi:hypothetical protein
MMGGYFFLFPLIISTIYDTMNWVDEMSSKEKREQQIRDNRTNVSLEDFEALINQYEYIVEGGKHPKAMIGNEPLSYKRINPVQRPYVDYLVVLIDIVKKGKGI